MEETEGQPAGAVAEAPPGDGATETTDAGAATFTPDHATELAADYSNIDAWIASETTRINAEVAASEAAEQQDGETAAEADPQPTTTAQAEATAAAPRSEPATETPPAARTDTATDFDEATVLQKLMERGYKVEAPAPPPDPFSDLTAKLEPLVGSAEHYGQIKARALAIPTEPANWTDAEAVERYEAAVRDRNEAAAEMAKLDLGRSVTDVAIPWARHRVLGEIGALLQGVPAKYGVDPTQAQRVTNPTAMTDAIDAVAEAINAQWQAKYDAREKHWQGEVARARSDTSAANLERMGRAPQATREAGGRAAPRFDEIVELDPKTGLVSDAWINRALRGEFAHIDTSDR